MNVNVTTLAGKGTGAKELRMSHDSIAGTDLISPSSLTSGSLTSASLTSRSTSVERTDTSASSIERRHTTSSSEGRSNASENGGSGSGGVSARRVPWRVRSLRAVRNNNVPSPSPLKMEKATIKDSSTPELRIRGAAA